MTSGCGDDSGASPPDAASGFDRRTLIANVADHYIIPTQNKFVTDTVALKTSVDAYCTALGAGNGAAALTAARASWISTMDTWQTAEAILVGPAARLDNTTRNRIYSWPFVAPCTIDNDVVKSWTTANYDVNVVFDNARSMSAIEYLLFYDSDVSSCPAVPFNWAELGANRAKARCKLAAVVAGDVAAAAVTLQTAWAPTGGNYRDQLVFAGSGGSTIETEREAVNMVSDALFYMDRMVWDMKVREPGGIKQNACGTVDAACVREAEHRYADHGTQAIRLNLAGLKDGFTGKGVDGTDGPGFDDYMIAVGAADVAARINAEIDAAIANAAALPDDYIVALTDQHDKVVTLSVSLKTIVTDFKTQFLTVLGLDIPAEIAGDND